MDGAREHDAPPGTVSMPQCHPADRAEDFAASGAWHPETFPDLFAAAVAARGDAGAVTDPPNLLSITGSAPRSLTWAQLDRLVDQYTVALYANGIRAGDVVAVWLPNTVDLIAVYFAIWRLGATATPMPMSYGSHEVATVLRASDACAIVTVTRFGDTTPAATALDIRNAQPSPLSVFTLGADAPAGTIDATAPPMAEAAAAEAQNAEAATARDYVAALPHSLNDRITICWTSGTEAAPKGVPRATAIGSRWATASRTASLSDRTRWYSILFRWSTWPASPAR